MNSAAATPIQDNYEAVLFIDNDEANIVNMRNICSNRVTLMKIPEIAAQVPATNFETDPTMRQYITDFIGWDNTYVKMLKKVTSSKARIDLTSGIQLPHIEQIKAWLQETARFGKNRALLVDWDRTITNVEGFVFLSRDFAGYSQAVRDYGFDIEEDVTKEDMLTFLCGGAVRLAALRSIFGQCAAEGVDVIVLTNNTACRSQNVMWSNDYSNGGMPMAPGFMELCEGIVPPGVNVGAICAGLPPYKGHKGLAFRDLLPTKTRTVCAALFGGAGGLKTRRRRRGRRSRASSKSRNGRRRGGAGGRTRRRY